MPYHAKGSNSSNQSERRYYECRERPRGRSPTPRKRSPSPRYEHSGPGQKSQDYYQENERYYQEDERYHSHSPDYYDEYQYNNPHVKCTTDTIDETIANTCIALARQVFGPSKMKESWDVHVREIEASKHQAFVSNAKGISVINSEHQPSSTAALVALEEALRNELYKRGGGPKLPSAPGNIDLGMIMGQPTQASAPQPQVLPATTSIRPLSWMHTPLLGTASGTELSASGPSGYSLRTVVPIGSSSLFSTGASKPQMGRPSSRIIVVRRSHRKRH